MSDRSLKTDSETESREPTKGSSKLERGEERKRARAEIRVRGLWTQTGKQSEEHTQGSLEREREGKRGKEEEQRSEQQVSEDRRGDREQRTFIWSS